MAEALTRFTLMRLRVAPVVSFDLTGLPINESSSQRLRERSSSQHQRSSDEFDSKKREPL